MRSCAYVKPRLSAVTQQSAFHSYFFRQKVIILHFVDRVRFGLYIVTFLIVAPYKYSYLLTYLLTYSLTHLYIRNDVFC